MEKEEFAKATEESAKGETKAQEKRKRTVTKAKAKVSKKKPKPTKPTKPPIVCASARRKMAIARAMVKAGKGEIRINRLALAALPQHVQQLITEPLQLASNVASMIDVDVNVRGGGVMGQAQAARTAIARAIVEYTRDEELKRTMLAHDRYLLIEDPRMIEPKKYKGRKARARFQKSYR